MDSAIQGERQLILKAKNDPEAFGQLYDRYYPRIFRFILSRTANIELTQDLTAETFFQALKSIWRFRLRSRPFSAWLYKIAITQIANFYRKKYNYCELSLDESPELINAPSLNISSKNFPELESEKIQQFKELHRLLQKLKPVQHNIILLRYFEEKSLKEISAILHIKQNTIKSHLRRAIIQLRELISKENNKILDAPKYRKQFKKMFKANGTGRN